MADLTTLKFEFRCTAYHEAGHLIVAHHEGFDTGPIALSPKGSGHAETSAFLPGASPVNYAASRLRVLLAGAVAQCLVLSPGQTTCVVEAFDERGNGSIDWKRAQEMARVVALSSLASPSTKADFVAETSRVIKAHQDFVEDLLVRNDKLLRSIGQLALEKFVEILEDHDADPWVDAAVLKAEQTNLVA